MSIEINRQVAENTFIKESKEKLETKTPIMVAGLPGKVAILVAEAIEMSENYILLDTGLSSPKHEGNFKAPFKRRHNLEDIFLMASPDSPSSLTEKHLQSIKEVHPEVIIIDFTNPEAVNVNAELYAKVGIPFVMGTTGGDRQKLFEAVKNSEINTVIDTNMAPHIVVMQAILEKAAEEFPEALSGWELSITESHQAGKKDVSGTARAWLPKFKALGAHLVGAIESIRDPKKQTDLGIQNIDGHGYHWFTIKSPDKKASFQIFTSVEGRAPYINGTLMAIEFLKEEMKGQKKGQIYSMVDVLRSQKNHNKD